MLDSAFTGHDFYFLTMLKFRIIWKYIDCFLISDKSADEGKKASPNTSGKRRKMRAEDFLEERKKVRKLLKERQLAVRERELKLLEDKRKSQQEEWCCVKFQQNSEQWVNCWRMGNWPDRSFFTQKGDKHDCNNYSGITLLSCLGKLFYQHHQWKTCKIVWAELDIERNTGT